MLSLKTTKNLYNKVKKVIETDSKTYSNIKLYHVVNLINDDTIRFNEVQNLDDCAVIIETVENRSYAEKIELVIDFKEKNQNYTILMSIRATTKELYN